MRARALETTTVTYDISMTTGNVYSLPQKFSWRRRSFALCWKQTRLSVDSTYTWILNQLQLRTVSVLNFNNRNLKSYLIPKWRIFFKREVLQNFEANPLLKLTVHAPKVGWSHKEPYLKPDNCTKYYLSPVSVFKLQKGVFLINLTRKILSREKFPFFREN